MVVLQIPAPRHHCPVFKMHNVYLLSSCRTAAPPFVSEFPKSFTITKTKALRNGLLAFCILTSSLTGAVSVSCLLCHVSSTYFNRREIVHLFQTSSKALRKS